MIEKLSVKDWKDYTKLLSQLSGFDKEITEEDFTEKFSDIRDPIYILKKEAKIVATARLVVIRKIHDPVVMIEDVVVDENYRRQGLGKKMIVHLLEQAKQLGCYKVITLTGDHNRSFYRSCGMDVTGISLTTFV